LDAVTTAKTEIKLNYWWIHKFN